MILHTIIGEYDILQAQNAVCAPKMQAIDGGFLEYSDTPQGRQVSRLFSTNPHLYLDAKYQPFTKLN